MNHYTTATLPYPKSNGVANAKTFVLDKPYLPGGKPPVPRGTAIVIYRSQGANVAGWMNTRNEHITHRN